MPIYIPSKKFHLKSNLIPNLKILEPIKKASVKITDASTKDIYIKVMDYSFKNTSSSSLRSILIGLSRFTFCAKISFDS